MSASCAVVKTSGKPPAAGHSSAAGTGISRRSLTTASSACPPPPTTAITRSPSANRSAPAPSAATSPASSIPGMSCGDPGGAGYRPRRCEMSPPFSPAARTRTSTSPFAGTGSGCSSMTIFSSRMVTARTGVKHRQAARRAARPQGWAPTATDMGSSRGRRRTPSSTAASSSERGMRSR